MIKNILDKSKDIVLDSVDLAEIGFYKLQSHLCDLKARWYELRAACCEFEKKRAYGKWLKELLVDNETEIYECFSKLSNE